MNDETKEILDYLKDDKWDYYPSDGIPYKVFLMEERDKLLDYITNLQEENERLNTELNSYKDEFCKDTIKEYELIMEQEYYKSRCEKAIEFCDYLLEHNEVVINDKTYIKQNGDDIITNAIKSKLLGGDE